MGCETVRVRFSYLVAHMPKSMHVSNCEGSVKQASVRPIAQALNEHLFISTSTDDHAFNGFSSQSNFRLSKIIAARLSTFLHEVLQWC